jgi:hypothetical protein
LEKVQELGGSIKLNEYLYPYILWIQEKGGTPQIWNNFFYASYPKTGFARNPKEVRSQKQRRKYLRSICVIFILNPDS